MKTNPSFRIFKPSTLVSLGIAIAAALVTQPMRASAIDSLVITENNSTSSGLTAMLTSNGTTTSLPVTFSGADSWKIALAGIGGDGEQWTEPDAAGFFNLVAPALPGQPDFGQKIVVRSDFGSLNAGVADGTTVTDPSRFTLNGAVLSVTFHDNGDVAAAPDTGSTLGLLSLSMVALLGATRLRFLQLAA